MTLPKDFLRHYPNQVPIAWLVRENNRKIWFRIHSLPESKRYPETDSEYAELLRRHNEIATDVVGEGNEVLLFWYGENPGGGIHGCKVLEYSDNYFETIIYVNADIWRVHKFDDFIKCVADERCSSSIFLATKSGNIYAPYDGGADIFIQDEKKLEALRSKYAKWFSTHESGM